MTPPTPNPLASPAAPSITPDARARHHRAQDHAQDHGTPDLPGEDRPLVVITGAAGNIGRSLAGALADRYRVVGLDLRDPGDTDFPIVTADFTADASMREAMAALGQDHGRRIASVVHLAAYFDFTGEDVPAYRAVNVDGTRRLLRGLRGFEVEQFVYAGTMLVHAPTAPGEVIDESRPIDPRWAYPRSKAQAEDVIRAEANGIPIVLLHLAGLYDATTAVPTLTHQIARIHQRDLQSHLYSGPVEAGQSMLHRDDMIDAFVRAVDRRQRLPQEAVILIGEPEALGYGEIQDRVGRMIHGEAGWRTIRVPAPIAAVGAWALAQAEPLVPDAIDQGEAPFVRPFMARMAADHYALDIAQARALLDWKPRHRLADGLAALVDALLSDPERWYARNRIPLPPTIAEAAATGRDAERLRRRDETLRRRAHRRSRWGHFANIGLGAWIASQPVVVQVDEPGLAIAEYLLGFALIVFATLSLSWRAGWARWTCAGIGALVMAIPFVFWTANPAAFLSDTLIGLLVIGFAVGPPPEVGPSAAAALTGPDVPPGWRYNPSTWTQRVPIIAFAVLGLLISRYLTGYQLGHVDSVWDPFFAGSAADPRNGTEEVITSAVSRAWPIPDAAVGGYTYALEIVTGLIGSQRRWRTMPWLVVLFGLMIVPLGVVSIVFIVIQPIVIGTWATLTLVAAAAMLVQIPYSIDELLATLQFVRRRMRAGASGLRVFLFGDTDVGTRAAREDGFDRPARAVLADMAGGGVSLPWNLALAAAVGIALMFTRGLVGASGAVANVDHVVGALALTVVSIAAAEVTRAARLLLVPLGIALCLAPLVLDTTSAQTAFDLVAGVLLIVAAWRRGPIRGRYGLWDRWIR